MNVTLVKPGADSAADIQADTISCQTSRFGTVELRADSVVEFPDGLVGIGGSRYALISSDPQNPLLWLQSLEQPGLALLVGNPHQFFTDFEVRVGDDEAQTLGFDDGRSVDVYVTVTPGKALSDFTANLKAPILIRDGRGHQLINHAPGAQIKTPLLRG